jgi:hypothetical protein
MNIDIIQNQKEIVLNHTGSGKPSFKKFHQAIRGLKNEMEIVLSIEDLLNDSNKGGTEVWARFIRNCLKFYDIRLKKYKTTKRNQELKRSLANNENQIAIGVVIAAYSKIQHLELSSSISADPNLDPFCVISQGKEKIEKICESMTDECAKDVLESIKEAVKNHNIKF